MLPKGVDLPDAAALTAARDAVAAEHAADAARPTADDLVRAFVEAEDTDTVADIKARMESKADTRTSR